ncbi:MAG: T9SS type A sorting domain-containing protein [Ignavibacteriae bacterium]|nr:T9SS type A sorting domain-containing protein [Ignavibacteriota bacterium]
MPSEAITGNGHRGKKVLPPRNVTGEEIIHPINPASYKYPSTHAIGPGDSIGFTTYDYGTNGSANHNVINYGDGALSIGRMAAQQPGITPPDRATWFSHSTDRGMTWQPFSRVEWFRTGWSNIDQLRAPIAGGIEVTVAHSGLRVNVDVARGAGSWVPATTGSTVGSYWPKLATGGDLNIHIIGGESSPPTGVVYTRSTDAGFSFNPVDLHVLGSHIPISDAWDVASKENKVVIVSCGQRAGTDLVMQVSTDNGNTWTQSTVYDVAGPGELPTGRHQPQPDGSCAVIMDNAGTIHVTWGNFMAVGDSLSNPQLYYSFDGGIMHWSSATDVITLISTAPVQADTIAGEPGAPGRDGNFATQPDIAVDANNNLYVVFSALIAEFDSSSKPYEHVFASMSSDGGLTWGSVVDITPGSGFDAAFPSLADFVDTHLYLVYNSDPLAGNSIHNNHPENRTAIMFLKVPVTDLVDVKEGGKVPVSYALDQNYPNPFNPSTRIQYTVPKRSGVELVVYDVLGQEVASLVNEYRNAGTYEHLFSAEDLPSGVYFYTLRAGSFLQTRKMILLK